MKSKVILFSLFTQFAFSQGGFSQKYDTQIINQEILESLYEKNDLQGVINELSKTPFLHPDYLNNQITIISHYSSLDKKDEALKICQDLLNNKLIDPNYQIPLIYGSLLSDAKEYDKALEQFDIAQKYIPNSPILRYNYALVYYRKEEIQKAINVLEENLKFFPYHASSIYMLGKIALDDNNFAVASSAFLTYLLTNPGGTHAKYILQILDKKTSSYYAAPSKYKYSNSGDNFEEFDLIFKNDFPLNKNYKLRIDFNEIYSRNLQAIFDYYKDHKFQDGFTENNFGKWIANVAETNKVKEITYYTLSSLLDSNPKLFGKNEKQIVNYIKTEEFYNLFKLYATKNIDGVKTHITLSDNLYKYTTFPNEMYDNNNFDGKLFYPTAILKREFKYRDGINVGIVKEYDEKGNLTFVADIKDEDNYKFTNYNPKTNKIISTGSYVNDKLNGLKTSSDIFGNKKLDENFKDNEFDGLTHLYYVDGSVKLNRGYKEGEFDGVYELFSSNNKIIAKGNYKQDEPDGKVEYFYVNGDVKGHDQGNNGKLEYSERRNVLGNVINKETYINGKISKSEVFDYSGKIESLSEFDKNGIIVKSQYFDNKGNLYYEDLYKNNDLASSMHYSVNYPKGVKVAKKGNYEYKDYNDQLIFTMPFKNGKADGVKKHYNKNGIVTSEEVFSNGTQTGLTKLYYSSGQLYKTTKYDNNKKNGLETVYTNLGSVISESNYVNGELDGMQTNYYANGKVSSYIYYSDGFKNGKSIEFNLAGEIERISYYSNDIIYKKENYIAGKLFSTDDRIDRNGTYEVKRSDAQTQIITTKNGILHGDYNLKLADGTIILTSSYKNSNLQGPYKEYNALGNLILSKNYEADLLQGEVLEYDIVGNLFIKSNYKNDIQIGSTKKYYPNGTVMVSSESFDNQENGETVYYNYKGQPVFALGYNKGNIEYYKVLEGKNLGNAITYNFKSKLNIISKYENGQNAIELTIDNGLLNDKFNIYQDNGTLIYGVVYKDFSFNKIVMNHENGKNYYVKNFEKSNKVGIQTFYDSTSKKLVEENYSFGYLHGKSIFYKNGVPVKTLNYDSDVVTSISK